MILKIKTANGKDIMELRVEELIEIDGRPFTEYKQVDAGNHEDRLRLLELQVNTICNFLDEKFPPAPQKEEPPTV
jgi:hypothetical protein